MALFYVFWCLATLISLDRNHIFEICKLILLDLYHVILSPKGFYSTIFRCEDIKHPVQKLRRRDIQCSTIETEPLRSYQTSNDPLQTAIMIPIKG